MGADWIQKNIFGSLAYECPLRLRSSLHFGYNCWHMAPSSRGLGHRIFSPSTGVRIPMGSLASESFWTRTLFLRISWCVFSSKGRKRVVRDRYFLFWKVFQPEHGLRRSFQSWPKSRLRKFASTSAKIDRIRLARMILLDEFRPMTRTLMN